MSDDTHNARPAIVGVFFAFRRTDLLFKRSIDLTDVPRVGEHIQMWFNDAANVRGTIRDVRWTIPKNGPPVVNIQIELGPSDRQRFAKRTPITE